MIRAEITYQRPRAIITLDDAQGWQITDQTPRYRAVFDYVEVKALDVYTIIVDKLPLQDEVGTSEALIFQMDKVIEDTAVTVETLAFSMAKPLSDTAVMIDGVVYQMDKPFTDTANAGDSVVYQMDKSPSDSAQAGDSFIGNLSSTASGELNNVTVNDADLNGNKIDTRVFTA